VAWREGIIRLTAGKHCRITRVARSDKISPNAILSEAADRQKWAPAITGGRILGYLLNDLRLETLGDTHLGYCSH